MNDGQKLPKLSAPAVRALASAGIETLSDFSKFTEKEFKKWHGIGPSAFLAIQKALAENGFSFKND